MDIIELHDQALAATTSIVANVDTTQFTLPSPCGDFDVRALIKHMVDGNYHFVNIARGEPGDAVPATDDFIHDDPLTSYEHSARALSAAWNTPGVLEKTVQLPFGAFPGAFALGIHTVEVIMHGWDLAKATGQPTELAPDLYAVAWAYCKDIDDSFRGPGRPFGPAVTPAPDASDTQRLVAWLGRQP